MDDLDNPNTNAMQQQQQQQRQGPFCTFCQGRDPRDHAKYTHFVRNPDGTVACPYLRITQCTQCFIPGHTAKHCTFFADMMAAEMEVKTVLVDQERFYSLPDEKRLELSIKHEKLIHRDNYQKHCRARFFEIQKMMRTGQIDPDFFQHGCCKYCYNYNNCDPIFMTHRVGACPRLACTRCKLCKELGHTQAKCEKPKMDALVAKLGKYDSQEFVIDFSEEEEPACHEVAMLQA